MDFYIGPFPALKGDIRIWGSIPCFPPSRLACGEWIRARLTGRAATADSAGYLLTTLKASFATIKAALKARFEPECQKELYMAEFQAWKKTQTEDWATYRVASFSEARRI